MIRSVDGGRIGPREERKEGRPAIEGVAAISPALDPIIEANLPAARAADMRGCWEARQAFPEGG